MDDARGESGTAIRCVLLTPRGGTTDERLVLLLESRGWHTHAFDDPYLALAELCLIERDGIARSSGNGGTRLVLQNGPAASKHTELVAATRQYVPTVATWAYDGCTLERIVAAEPALAPRAETRPETEPSLPLPGEADTVQPLRLADPPPAAPPPPPIEEDLEDDHHDGGRVTAEEIALLFSAEHPEGSAS